MNATITIEAPPAMLPPESRANGLVEALGSYTLTDQTEETPRGRWIIELFGLSSVDQGVLNQRCRTLSSLYPEAVIELTWEDYDSEEGTAGNRWQGGTLVALGFTELVWRDTGFEGNR